MEQSSNRRNFLRGATAAAFGAAQAAAQRTAASDRRVKGANDIINVGLIGLGNISRGHIQGLMGAEDQVKIVAVCDIYKPRLERAAQITKARAYHDYKELLADPGIDAVFVLTPDHWHAQMAIDAMRAGKDVDVEKPMSLTIEEAREMVRVARETGRILAVDSEHTAHGIWQPARAAIQAGVLGKLLWSQTSRSRNSAEPPWNYNIEPEATPENIDWQRFLGSTRKVPFDAERFFRWRRYWDYSGGIATDLYVHHLTPLMKITGPEFPARVVSAGGSWIVPQDVMEVPETFVMAVDFPAKHTIVVGGSLANSVELPIVVRGHEANIRLFGNHLRPDYLLLEPEAPFAEKVRDGIAKAGLEGRWIRPQGGAGGGVSFRELPKERREEMIAGVLGNAEVNEAYNSALRKDPSLRTDDAKRLRFFQKFVEPQTRQGPVQEVFRIDSPPAESFRDNFLRCVRTREKPVLDGELGYMVQVAVVMANQAYRENRVKFFDPKSEQIVDRQP
jgi:predicted dehydrogenase